MSQTFRDFQKSSNNFNGLTHECLYSLQGVSVTFRSLKALNNISCKLHKGEIYFITGKSGAGKTTLLNLLSGDLKASVGKIKYPTKSIFVSQVFQDLKLFKDLSVEENLWYSFDKSIYKSKNEFYKDLTELSSVLGIQDRLHLKVKDANGGLKQSCAMVRALLTKPEVLLADEPTSSLDRDRAVKLFELLNFYNVKKGVTIVWASHNRDLVKQFPGKIIHLEKGKLVYSGHACFI